VGIDPEAGNTTAPVPPALPAAVRVPLAVAAVGGAVAVVVLGVLFAGQVSGTAFDAWIRSPLMELHSPWRQIALIVDYTAEPVGAVLVIGTLTLVFFRLGHRRAALLTVAGTGASVALTTVLKPVVGRDINNGFLAFPSGHTAAATALTLVAMLVLVQRRQLGTTTATVLTAVVTVFAALSMAWAQVLLNSHYPTDTVGGFATALAVVPVVGYAIDRVADRAQGLETRK
jgi:membrane-associated phospholipid phosphatase